MMRLSASWWTVPAWTWWATPRVVHIFDGHDIDAVVRAREAWAVAKEQGLTVSYWQQDEGGRWQKKA